MRIAIVNDLLSAIEGLRRSIQASNEHEIVWIAWNGIEAVEQCCKDLPDLILMDLIMPEMGGVEATKKIMDNTPCPILIVTASINQYSDLVFEAMSAGAMDVVVIPSLNSVNNGRHKNNLMGKIHNIDILTRTGVSDVNQHHKIRDQRQSYTADTHLIAIGCSSGGPDALSTLFSDIPRSINAAFVVIQHIDEQFVPGLANWLNHKTELNVGVVKDGDCPQAGEVFIAKTNKQLIINNNQLFEYITDPQDTFYHPSVDVFFYSVLNNWRKPVTAILLTGMGKDGAQGLRELKNNGFHTIAQDKSTSAVYGMPRAAKELKAVCEIKSVHAISRYIQEHFQSSQVNWV